jgi:lysophospholipase L1-like esterase
MNKYLFTIIAVVSIAIIGSASYEMGRQTASLSSSTVVQLSSVALGDSVAAGLGLTPDSDSSACGRTDQSYPFLVAKAKNLHLTNLACSGATLAEGILGSQNVNQLQETPQLEKLFTLPRPSLITLTIGDNDVNWTQLLAKCYTGVCGSDADTAVIDAHLAPIATNLTTTLARIQNHYPSMSPQVIVTGYYQILPAKIGSCVDATGITNAESAWVQARQESINSTLRNVVGKFTFATFVPVDFSGHELCSSNSWVQGLSDKAPYHPTSDGQAAIAQAVEASLKVLK